MVGTVWSNPMWVGLLLILSLVTLVLEMFIPSGGILSGIAAIGFLVSIYFAFQSGATFGMIYLVVLAAGLPLVVMAMVKIWPHTFMGRMMLNMPPPGSEPEPVFNPLEDLIGKQGIAKSKMLLSGAVSIDGRTYDATSDGMAVEPGDRIEVVRVEGGHITVRACDATTRQNDSLSPGQSPKAPNDHGSGDRSAGVSSAESDRPNVLDRTYDDAIVDPFENE